MPLFRSDCRSLILDDLPLAHLVCQPTNSLVGGGQHLPPARFVCDLRLIPGELTGAFASRQKIEAIEAVLENETWSEPIIVGMDRNFISSELSFYDFVDYDAVNTSIRETLHSTSPDPVTDAGKRQ